MIYNINTNVIYMILFEYECISANTYFGMIN